MAIHKSTWGRNELLTPRDPAAFDYNLTYSPLHNVNPHKTYPAVVLACADHDDRVVPAHSFKLAAELQHKLPTNSNPLLLRVELQAGHGAGKSTQKRIEEASDSTWYTRALAHRRICDRRASAQLGAGVGKARARGAAPPTQGHLESTWPTNRLPDSAHYRRQCPCPWCESLLCR